MEEKEVTGEEALAAAKLIRKYCRSHNGSCNKDNCTFNDNNSWCNLAGILEDWTNTPDEWELE